MCINLGDNLAGTRRSEIQIANEYVLKGEKEKSVESI